MKGKKTKVVIKGVAYNIPQIVFNEFKKIAMEREQLDLAVEILKEYIHNYTGTGAKA